MIKEAAISIYLIVISTVFKFFRLMPLKEKTIMLTSFGDNIEYVIDEVKKHFGDYVFDTHIPRNVRLAESPSFGKTIFEHDKWSKGARAYKALTKEILAR